ncbi:MAG TPA: hypothetical protein VEV17_20045 [Bryobacteraceae bacterium]|nr:hypothetical protein [Bryobacteraceae bacterium]
MMAPNSGRRLAVYPNAAYVAAVLLLPLLILWHRDNVLFSPPMHTDPWFYLGYFRTLADFKRDLFPNFHGGGRYSWILPGYLLHSWFPPVAANFLLHLTVHSAAVLALFSILRTTSGARAAFLTAMAFSLHPWLWAATGWDYVDGPGIAYCLLTLACLTRSAVRPVRAGSLVLAGVALAGMLYTNLSWIAVAPLLLMYYFALLWARWRRALQMRSWLVAPLWLGAGFGIVTAAFGAVDYALDGTLWFLAPAIATARNYGADWRWVQSIWDRGGLGSWLWFPVLAAITALVLLPFRLKRGAVAKNAPALLFSALLFLTAAVMAYLQLRGISVLGQYFYASHLLPFAFLVIGSSFWQATIAMTQRAFLALCLVAAALFGGIWYHAEQWLLPERATVLAGAALLGIALVLRWRTIAVVPAVAGLLLFTGVVAPEAVRVHGTRAQYDRVMLARARIENVRRGNPVWFWFDQSDPNLPDYFALNSTYLAEFSRLGSAFPQYGCEVKLEAGALIVASSQDPHAPELALSPLARCWGPYGMRPAIEEEDRYQAGSRSYTIALIRATADPGLRHPLRPAFDPSSQGYLEIASNSSAAALAFPADRWREFHYPADNGRVEITQRGMEVRTPRRAYASVLTYAPLVAPVTGRYRFALQYSRRSGHFAFGARTPDDTRYLAEDTGGHRSGAIREMALWVDLQAGETVLLRIANNNNAGNGAASFVLEKLSALEVDPVDRAPAQPDPGPGRAPHRAPR